MSVCEPNCPAHIGRMASTRYSLPGRRTKQIVDRHIKEVRGVGIEYAAMRKLLRD